MTAVLAGAGVVLVGCEMMETAPQSTPTTTLRYKLPTLTPVEPDKQDQEKDGIRISVAPYSYTPRTLVQSEYRRMPSILIVNDQYPAEMRETPSVVVMPEMVGFKVKIYNRLERVLRLAGTVVSFQVAGKMADIPRARYENFLNGIILPRQEAEYELGGPDLAAMPDSATVALLLYDIVTATDAAGNPTQRSNFEFFYTLSRQDKEQEASVKVSRVMLNRGAAALLLQREQSEGQWVSIPEIDLAK